MKTGIKTGTARRSTSKKNSAQRASQVECLLSKGQRAKLVATARVFGCSEGEMLAALAMGCLSMLGNVEHDGGAEENRLTLAEFVQQFGRDRRTPPFTPSLHAEGGVQ